MDEVRNRTMSQGTRDFAKMAPTPRPVPPQMKQQNVFSANFKFFTIIILLVAMFIGGLVYMQLTQHRSITDFLPTKQQSEIPHARKRPRFEFYTVLPKNNDSASHQIVQEEDRQYRDIGSNRTQLPNAAQVYKKTTPVKQAHKAKPLRYMLQIASFKHAQDAERMKADLLLRGFEPRIVRFKYKGKTWHRLSLGPFRNLKRAKRAQAHLRNKRLKAIIRVA